MKDSNYGRWMEEKMVEMRGIVRDYVRMRNIKRATVMEFGQLITPAAGQSSYLHEEEIWGEDPVHYTSKEYSLAALDWSLWCTRRGVRRGRPGPVEDRAPPRRPSWT
jgi:hypothetical protein